VSNNLPQDICERPPARVCAGEISLRVQHIGRQPRSC
jgi:hypothetical protein